MGSGGSAVLKPLRGVQNVLMFDSHTLPPYATMRFCARGLLRAAKALFCFAWFAVPSALSGDGFGFACRVSSTPMEVFCRMTTVRRADLSCVVQAGGLSSRMGCDKARMAFCGEPLIERVLVGWRQLPASWS